MRPSILAGGIALACSLVSGAAFAQATQAQRAACTPDVFRLCSGDIPNVTRITACLRSQRTSLSSACTAVFDAVDRGPVATRSLSSRPVSSAAWCEFGASPLPGQDVWIAWCEEMAQPN